VARRPPPYDYPEPFPEAFITIHGRVYPGVLRRHSWSDEHNARRWTVEVWVDDRRVMTSVSADQIKLVRSAENA
jgi:hypothetical protein